MRSGLLAAELKKAFSGRAWIVIGMIGPFMAILSVAGSASDATESIAAGMPMSEVTATSIRFWFMAQLSSLIFGATLVTREWANGSIARSVLLSGGRSRLFAAKTAVATIVAGLYGVVVVVLMIVSAWVLVPLSGQPAVWTDEATRTVIGVFVVIVASGPWGAMFGWVIRSQGAAIAALLVVTLVVDEGLLRLIPAIGKFTMQIAMGAVYLDGKPEMLPVPAAAVVMVAWLVLAGVVAHSQFVRRDVL